MRIALLVIFLFILYVLFELFWFYKAYFYLIFPIAFILFFLYQVFSFLKKERSKESKEDINQFKNVGSFEAEPPTPLDRVQQEMGQGWREIEDELDQKLNRPSKDSDRK